MYGFYNAINFNSDLSNRNVNDMFDGDASSNSYF